MSKYNTGSLYVGDLKPEVNEAFLYELFRKAGPILSIKVCRDAITSKSLGYAYVNFQKPKDAERALDALNYTNVKGKPIRIMWSQRDPSVRKSGVGNIFIKNLDKSIDNKALYDAFSTFGNILSCKVCRKLVESVDKKTNKKVLKNESLGYGFVHFDKAESAELAISKLNGMLINGKKVFVGHFVGKTERVKSGQQSFTNIYVNNLDASVTDEDLKKMFQEFGEVTSCKVTVDEKTKESKQFGFVNFKEPKAAAKAVKAMNGKVIKDWDSKLEPMTVVRAMKKEERKKYLTDQFLKRKLENIKKTQGSNLYVKNFDDSIDDEKKLVKLFEKYGKINSCVIMKDKNKKSKGFGFICFEKPEAAAKAITEMNGKMVGNKPLFVTLAQRKEARRQQLELIHQQRNRMNQQMNSNQIYNNNPYFNGMNQQGMYNNQVRPRWSNQKKESK